MELNKEIKLRFRLVQACLRFSMRESLAYSINNYGMMLSTIFYMVTYLAFIDAVFGNLPNLAGFSYNEILFMTVINQISFFTVWSLSMNNIEKLISDIFTGNLDLLLLKPVPHLWFVSSRSINLIDVFGHGIPSTIMPILLLIIKGGVELKIYNLIIGALIMVLGLMIVHCFQFIVSTFSFMTENGKGLNRLSFELSFFGEATPWTGFPDWYKVIGLTIIPNLFHIVLASAVMLNKVDNELNWLGYTLILTLVALYLKNYFWKIGLKYYVSASS